MGDNLSNASVSTRCGWNLIGAIKDCEMPFALFEYLNGSYEKVDNVEPGKGYWHFQIEQGEQTRTL